MWHNEAVNIKAAWSIWEHAVSQCVHVLMRYESGRLEGEYLTPMCWRQSMEAVAFPPALSLFLITPSVSVRLLGPPQPRRSGKRREPLQNSLMTVNLIFQLPPSYPIQTHCPGEPSAAQGQTTPAQRRPTAERKCSKPHCCNSTDLRYSGFRTLSGAKKEFAGDIGAQKSYECQSYTKLNHTTN